MAMTAIASLRPLSGACMRHATSGLLSVQIRCNKTTFQLQTVVPLQRRFQSSPRLNPKDKPPQQQQNITFRQFIGRALGAGLRNLALAFTPQGIRSAYQDTPFQTTFTLALLVVFFGIGASGLVWFYRTFYSPEFSRFPEPVANTMRRAIYYTNYFPDAELAYKYYKLALEQCVEVGLDPFSDEVLGIRIQVAAWLEKIANYKQAIEILEAIRGDCRKWVDTMEQAVREDKVDKQGRYVSSDVDGSSPGSSPSSDSGETGEVIEPVETLWHKRQRLLKKAIGISVKLGELYGDEHVLDADKSHSHLVWALETSLKEIQRRRKEGPKPGEADWLTPEELGGSLESLGLDYMRRSQFHLAIPLFFQALQLCETPCHRAVLMNNLSASYAQHPIYSPTATEPLESMKELFDSSLPSTRKDCLEAASNWARNAKQHADDVKGVDRTPECDEACAIALCNWGDVAAMLGKVETARKKYHQSIEMCRRLDFGPGLKQAQDGLASLK